MIFLSLMTAEIAINILLTQAVKTALGDKFKYSSNLLALLDAIIVGIGGTAFYFYLSGIEFTGKNCIYMVPLCAILWIGSTVGYDKVVQTVMQVIGENQK